MSDIYNTMHPKVVMYRFNKVLWRHGEENDYIWGSQEDYREDEALELDF